MKLIVGNKNYSSWSLRPWLAMKVAGIAFSEQRIPLYGPGSKEQILAFSPAGKVPCLIDGSLAVWDSLSICEYLADISGSSYPTSTCGGTRGIITHRSIRSRSGPETREA